MISSLEPDKAERARVVALIAALFRVCEEVAVAGKRAAGEVINDPESDKELCENAEELLSDAEEVVGRKYRYGAV